MNPNIAKKYDFDIDASVNSYAGELALPYVTAAVLGAETINKGRVRLIEGVVQTLSKRLHAPEPMGRILL